MKSEEAGQVRNSISKGSAKPLHEDSLYDPHPGASLKLREALVEHVFGGHWNGKPPDGAIMNRFENRDRLVAFVVEKLKTLWTLEA